MRASERPPLSVVVLSSSPSGSADPSRGPPSRRLDPGGGKQGPHKVEGSAFRSILPSSTDHFFEVLLVTDDEAFETCRVLAREEGLLVGGSSGVAAAVALRIARRLGPGKTVVTLFPDGAERYPGQGILQRSL